MSKIFFFKINQTVNQAITIKPHVDWAQILHVAEKGPKTNNLSLPKGPYEQQSTGPRICDFLMNDDLYGCYIIIHWVIELSYKQVRAGHANLILF